MANGNLLSMIANPKVADPQGAFNRGRESSLARNVLQEQAIGQKGKNVDAATARQRSSDAYSVLAAFTVGPGEQRNAILQQLSKSEDPATKQVATGFLSLPEGKEKEAKFTNMIDYFSEAGYLPKKEKGGLTPKQQERKLAVAERKAKVEEENVRLREEELKAGGKSGTLSKRGRLLKERDALDPDMPDYAERVAGYNRDLESLGKKQDTSEDMKQSAKILAFQVMDGLLDPNKISKRQGLQAEVFSIIGEVDPEFSLVEAEANARFKNTPANLQSRALIGGIMGDEIHLFDELLETGEKLHNTRYPIINRAVNFIKEQKGDPEVVAFNNLRDDVIAETERILLGSGVLSDTKYTRALGNINTAQSFPQLKAAIKQMKLVVKARKSALDAMPFGEVSKIRRAEIEKFGKRVREASRARKAIASKARRAKKGIEQPMQQEAQKQNTVINFDAQGNQI